MNRHCVTIEFGGALPRSKVSELAKIIARSGAGWDYGEYYNDTDTEKIAHQLSEASAVEATFDLYDDQGTCLTLEELRAFLVANQMPYHEKWGDGGDGGECEQWWAPPMEEEETGSTSDGASCVMLVELEKLLLAFEDPADIKVALTNLIQSRKPIEVPALSIKEDA